MRIAICDDLKEDRERLCTALTQGFQDHGEQCEIFVFQSGDELLEYMINYPGCFNAIFLDIFMNGISGVDTARELREAGETSMIYFISTSPDFGPESYEVGAKGYIKKPFNKEKIDKIIQTLLVEVNKPKICVKVNRKRRYIYLTDIIYVETREHTAMFHLVSGESVSCQEKLKNIQQMLRDIRFLKCNRSYLINMDYVESVKDEFIMKNNAIIPIKIRGRKEITNNYYNYFIFKAMSDLKERDIE